MVSSQNFYCWVQTTHLLMESGVVSDRLMATFETCAAMPCVSAKLGCCTVYCRLLLLLLEAVVCFGPTDDGLLYLDAV